MNTDSGFEIYTREGCSFSVFRDAPSWDGMRTAAIGRLKIGSEAVARTMLADAAADLSRQGFEAIVGPMDGDTWHTYRAVTETDGSPPFLMEPVSGPHDIAALKAAGFAAIGQYVSMRVATRDSIEVRPKQLPGIEIVNWNGERPEDFFSEVFDLSMEGFSRNAFFKPISRSTFLGLYMPFVPLLRRELIFFARGPGGDLVGFLFGIPDYAQGNRPTTAILKTYTSTVRGVGHLLADAFHRHALRLGYETVVHALIREDNVSRDRSRRHGGEVFRRYALFGRTI